MATDNPKPDVEEIQRRADDFARRAYADVVKRFKPLQEKSPDPDDPSEPPSKGTV